MYTFIRIIFWGIIFVVACLWIVKKSKIVKKKRVVIIVFVLCSLFASVSSLIPIENLFLDFEKPNDVFEYVRSGDVERVVVGNESTLLMYVNEDRSTHGYIIIPRIQGRYVIPSLFSVRRILRRHDCDGLFSVYNVHGTRDYFIIGQITTNTEISVIDSNGMEVEIERVKLAESIYLNLIRSYVYDFGYDFHFIVDGEKVRFER
jgi:hypothetical protein